MRTASARHAEAQRGFLRVSVAQHVVAGFVDGFGHGPDDGAAAPVAGGIVGGAQTVQIIIEKAGGVFDQLREGGRAGFLDETVRIMRRGHGGHADGQAGGQQAVERADGGVLAGVVGIKAEDDFIDVAFENAGMIGGQGGALRGDDVLDAAP